MLISKIGNKILNRIKYGCDLEDYDYLQNGFIKWSDNHKKRINLVISTIDKTRMYGGLSTALNFFETITNAYEDFDARIIVTSIPVNNDSAAFYPDYIVVENDESNSKYEIFDYSIKNKKRPTLTVRDNDIFLCTYWTTMYMANEIRNQQKEHYKNYNPLIYLIQDYEPGFYKWSTEYMLAESTYKVDNTIAVMNSKNLRDYFELLKYDFYKTYHFEPKLNRGLKKVLLDTEEKERKKRIIIYGRPFNGRNCFSLIIAALNKAIEDCSELKDWEIWSIGAKHKNIRLKKDKTLICKGKLSINDYGNILLDSRVGISIMCSPHPSYPPLEMATFGVNTITNTFLAKDLSGFSQNIMSVNTPTILSLSHAIVKCCQLPSGTIDYQSKYIDDIDQFTNIVDDIKKIL